MQMKGGQTEQNNQRTYNGPLRRVRVAIAAARNQC
jgi:hypothetical protein